MRSISLCLSLSLVCAFAAGQAPVNDECAGAIPLTTGVNPPQSPPCATFNNTGATTSTGFGSTCSTINSDVWFSFTPATTCSYTIDTSALAGCPTTGQLSDTVVLAYDACTATSALGCDDDSGLGLMSALTLTLNAGTTYFIRVGDFGTTVNQGTFNVTIIPHFTLAFSSPGPGCVQVNMDCGTPNGNYFFAVTTFQGTMPGYFFGLDIPFQELVNEFNAGPPFTGMLNAAGSAQLGPICGAPSGLTLNAVALDFGLGGYNIPVEASNVVSFTIP
jgi:hypothetical protein